MSVLSECFACLSGNHGKHVAWVVRPPEGGLGGVLCPCKGECTDRMEYPDILNEDVSAPVEWWWTEKGREEHARRQRAEAWEEGYARGVRDELGDIERADNPYLT